MINHLFSFTPGSFSISHDVAAANFTQTIHTKFWSNSLCSKRSQSAHFVLTFSFLFGSFRATNKFDRLTVKEELAKHPPPTYFSIPT